MAAQFELRSPRSPEAAEVVLQPGFVGQEARVCYREQPPPDELASVVDRLYVLESRAAVEQYCVVADGCADLLFDLRQQQAPVLSVSLAQAMPVPLPAGLRLVGVRLKPGVLARLLRIAPAALDGGMHLLDALPIAAQLTLPRSPASAEALLDALCDRLAELPPFDGEQQLVQAAIAHLQRSAIAGDDTALAEHLGVSERHARRLVQRHLGISPKRYQRVRRFQHSLQALAAQPQTPLAALAADHGYSDQAHLGHEWLALSSLTPGAWHGRFLQEPATAAR